MLFAEPIPDTHDGETMKSAPHSPPSSGRRFLTGLLGAPIANSAAPAMHERAAAAQELRCIIGKNKAVPLRHFHTRNFNSR